MSACRHCGADLGDKPPAHGYCGGVCRSAARRERDAEKVRRDLEAARRLVAQHDGSKRGRGRPKKILPPPGSKPDLPPQAWACLETEFSHGWIGVISADEVRQELAEQGITLSREAVRKWRAKPIYKLGFAWLFAEWQKDNRDASDLEQDIREQARARLPRWVASRWFGAIRSMHNGAIYVTAKDYAEHLLAANHTGLGSLPVELIEDVRAELLADRRRVLRDAYLKS
jgi:hypothetical protein